MARTNKTVRQAIFRKIKARIGRVPTDDELVMLVDLLDAYAEICREQSQRWKEVAARVPSAMLQGNQTYYSHLVAGFQWAASTLVNIIEAKSGKPGINHSRRRSDQRSAPDSRRDDNP
jgi:hypothetical protein